MGFLSQYNDLTLFEQIIFLICHMFYLQLFVEGLVPYCVVFLCKLAHSDVLNFVLSNVFTF